MLVSSTQLMCLVALVLSSDTFPLPPAQPQRRAAQRPCTHKMSRIPVSPPFLTPSKLPRYRPNLQACDWIYVLYDHGAGLGGRQRAVRPVDLKSRSIRGEDVELAFTRAQHTL